MRLKIITQSEENTDSHGNRSSKVIKMDQLKVTDADI